MTAIDVEKPRKLKKWRPSFAGTVFRNVQMVDRVLTLRTQIGECYLSAPQHWQQISGRWYVILDWRK